MTKYFLFRSGIDLLLSAFFAVVLWYTPYIFKFPSSSDCKEIAVALLGASASLLGFVLAASTFLISHLQHERFQILRGAKSYQQLPELVGSNLWRLLMLTILLAATLFLEPAMLKLAFGLVLFVGCWSLMAFTALIWVVVRIYSIPLTND